MPQPLAARFSGMAEGERDLAMAAEKRARHAGMAGVDEIKESGADGGQEQGHSGMDHRLMQDDKEEEVSRLVKLLITAVDCIPGCE